MMSTQMTAEPISASNQRFQNDTTLSDAFFLTFGFLHLLDGALAAKS